MKHLTLLTKAQLNRTGGFDLDPFFLFADPEGNECVADIAPEATLQSVQISCSTVRDHRRGGKRLSDLEVVIPCDSPPHVIFTWSSWCLVHDETLQIFREEGLTGFSVRRARVSLKKTGAPVAVSELVVTGWGGMAPEASGIREVERCEECGHLHYSAIEEPRELIDLKNWDGSDFFMVWPLPMFRFVTSRVAEVCRKYKISGVSLERNFPAPGRVVSSGYSPGRLSYYMPSERAHALGDKLEIY
jgi:hypothetical protein